MAEEVSNKTIAVLVAVVLVISVVGTWTIVSQSADQPKYVNLGARDDNEGGRVSLEYNKPIEMPQKAEVSLNKVG